jgi:hypothetical protein
MTEHFRADVDAGRAIAGIQERPGEAAGSDAQLEHARAGGEKGVRGLQVEIHVLLEIGEEEVVDLGVLAILGSGVAGARRPLHVHDHLLSEKAVGIIGPVPNWFLTRL